MFELFAEHPRGGTSSRTLNRDGVHRLLVCLCGLERAHSPQSSQVEDMSFRDRAQQLAKDLIDVSGAPHLPCDAFLNWYVWLLCWCDCRCPP